MAHATLLQRGKGETKNSEKPGVRKHNLAETPGYSECNREGLQPSRVGPSSGRFCGVASSEGNGPP